MRIFIIDDDELSAFLTQAVLLLEDATLDIRCFLSAGKALEALTKEGAASKPDAMLLDLNMPVMDGWAFLDAMTGRAPELIGQCNSYVLSSSIDPVDEQRSEERTRASNNSSSLYSSKPQ